MCLNGMGARGGEEAVWGGVGQPKGEGRFLVI